MEPSIEAAAACSGAAGAWGLVCTAHGLTTGWFSERSPPCSSGLPSPAGAPGTACGAETSFPGCSVPRGGGGRHRLPWRGSPGPTLQVARSQWASCFLSAGTEDAYPAAWCTAWEVGDGVLCLPSSPGLPSQSTSSFHPGDFCDLSAVLFRGWGYT